MATFFGEILQDFSRAVDDDEDEEDATETIESRIQWCPSGEVDKLANGKLPCGVLIVALGSAAVGFVQTYMLSREFELVGAIHSSTEDKDLTSPREVSPSDRTGYIHRSRQAPHVLVCLCTTAVDPEESHSWVHQLFSSIDTTSPQFYLNILTSYMTSEYKSEVSISDMGAPFLRALRTTIYPGTPPCPYLEQPNLVTGLPAQLLTHCQIANMKAVMYICYTDSIFLDIPTIKTFLPLLKTTPIRDIIQEKTVSEDTINQVVELYSVKNTLYL